MSGQPGGRPATGRPTTGRPADGQPLLQAVNLTKRFGNLTAVNKVSFSINAGEILGLIGPNGAGKTTLLSLASAKNSGRGNLLTRSFILFY